MDRPVSIDVVTDLFTDVWSLNGDHFADMTTVGGKKSSAGRRSPWNMD